jgi:uncharacterized protein DUF3179
MYALITTLVLATHPLPVQDADPHLGSWELSVSLGGRSYTSDLLLERTSSGRLVGELTRRGQRHVLGGLKLDGPELAFEVSDSLSFEGGFEGEQLRGLFSLPLGELSCVGVRPEPPSPFAAVLGVWHMESDFRGQTIPANLILDEQDGELVGVWESMDQEMDLSEISFDGESLRFARPMGRGGALLQFEGRVEDKQLQGVQRSGDMRIECTGSRFRLDRDGPDEGAPSLAESKDRETYLDDLEADYDRHAGRAVARDGFDVLDDPQLVPAEEAGTLTDDEFVLGVVVGGEARAYPIGALGSSELLNDVCGEVPIAASW